MIRSLLALVAVLLVAAPARACDCAPQTVAQALEASSAVFAGEVTARRVRFRTFRDPTGKRRAVRYPMNVHGFRVDSVWKGDVAERIEVWSDRFSDCGLRFEVGDRLIVYALGGEEGRYTTNLCSRTRKDEEEERIELGPARSPPGTEEDPGWMGR